MTAPTHGDRLTGEFWYCQNIHSPAPSGHWHDASEDARPTDRTFARRVMSLEANVADHEAAIGHLYELVKGRTVSPGSSVVPDQEIHRAPRCRAGEPSPESEAGAQSHKRRSSHDAPRDHQGRPAGPARCRPLVRGDVGGHLRHRRGGAGVTLFIFLLAVLVAGLLAAGVVVL